MKTSVNFCGKQEKVDFFLAKSKKAVYLHRSKPIGVTMTPPDCGFFCGHTLIINRAKTAPTDGVAETPPGSHRLNLEHPYRSLLFNVQNQSKMNEQRQTAGQTALQEALRKVGKRLIVMIDCHWAHNINIDITGMKVKELNEIISVCDDLGFLHVIREGGVR